MQANGPRRPARPVRSGCQGGHHGSESQAPGQPGVDAATGGAHRVRSDAIVRDPADTTRLRRDYDAGDHIHFNPAGYAAVANSIPLAALDDKLK